MKDPKIALVDLNHPCLQEPGKKLEASSILAWLKKNRLARWARYRGCTEILFWASIPLEAIVHTFSLSKLTTLSRDSHICASILGLQEFQPDRSTGQVAAQLRDRDMPFSPGAIAKIARTFLDEPNVQIKHIRDLVATLVSLLSAAR